MQTGDSQFLGDVTITGESYGFSEHGVWHSSSESISAGATLQIDIPLSKSGYSWGTIWLANSNTAIGDESQGIVVYFSNNTSETVCFEGAQYGATYSKTVGHSILSDDWLGTDIQLQDCALNTSGDTIEVVVYNSSISLPRNLSAFMVWRVLQ